MTYYSGKDGTLTYGPNSVAVAKVSSWSFSSSVDTLETTALTDGDRSYVPGLRQFSGSATIFYYENPPNDSAPKPLLQRIVGMSAVSESDILVLKLGWGGKYVQGNVIITSGELNCAVGEVMQATIQFQFTGTLTGVTL